MGIVLGVVAAYLAASYGLLAYIVWKLQAGRRMRRLVGPQWLGVTRPPFRAISTTQPAARDSRSAMRDAMKQVREAAA